MTRRLSVVIPCFNEEATIESLIERVLASPFVREVVVVDDGSTDATLERARKASTDRVRVLQQPFNMGKGAALRRGFGEVTSEFVIVQDADLEYDPSDYETVLEPLLDGRADVVFGSRFHTSRPHRVLYYWHFVGNRILTTLSNLFTNLNLSDMETCYKAFRREVIQSIDIEEDRFGFEPEVTAKVAGGDWRIYEVGISYSGRKYEEGKKIGWKDGFRALYCIVRYSPLVARMLARRRSRVIAERVGGAMSAAEVEWFLELARPHLGSKIVQLGASNPLLTERLAQHGAVVAVAESARTVEALQRLFANNPDVSVEFGELTDLVGLYSADTFVLIDTIDDTEEGLAALKEAAKGVEPGGLLLLRLPTRVSGVRAGFSRRRVRRVLAEAGLAPVELHYLNFPGALIAWGMRRVSAKAANGSASPPGQVLIPLARSFERRWAPPIGAVIFCVARVAQLPGA